MNNYTIPPNCQIENLNGIYQKYFGYTHTGYFVDVGAYNGYDHSNTYGLALAGWKGIMIEPITAYYEQCKKRLKDNWLGDVKVINTAIGDKTGYEEMDLAYSLSSCSPEQIRIVENTTWGRPLVLHQKIKVPITTLDIILYRENILPNFEVLSIDVEGYETKVLQGFHIDCWKPQMVIIEAQETHEIPEFRKQAPFINQYFLDHKYTKIYSDHINNIYVH